MNHEKLDDLFKAYDKLKSVITLKGQEFEKFEILIEEIKKGKFNEQQAKVELNNVWDRCFEPMKNRIMLPEAKELVRIFEENIR